MIEQNWVRDNGTRQKLGPPISSTSPSLLFARVQKLNRGFSILHYLQDNLKTLTTAEGIAVHLKCPVGAIEVDLTNLVEPGLVHPMEVAGIVFFGLDTDPAKRKLVRDLLAHPNRRYT